MSIRRGLIIIPTFCLLIGIADAREWMNSLGTQKYEAEFVELQGGNVCLRLKDGTIISLPLGKLCPRDHDFALQSAAIANTKPAIPASIAREWTDSTGKLKVKAEFIELKDGIVKVKLPNGTIKSVSIDRLGPPDQDFARRSAAAQLVPLARDSPQGLDPPTSEVIAAWERAGAEFGWISPNETLRLHGTKKPRPTERTVGTDKGEATLPPFRKTLSGTHEVRVLNPNDFVATVGVRSGDSGKDFDVGANGGRESIFVPNGMYDIYFIYSNQPNDLNQGDRFSIDGNGIEITITEVVNGNYGIRKVN